VRDGPAAVLRLPALRRALRVPHAAAQRVSPVLL
jgi:hypothetical protein